MTFPRIPMSMVVSVMTAAWLTSPALGQLGILTSAVGAGEIQRADGSSATWGIGETIEEGDRVVTAGDAYGMIFFVSGLGAADIEFEGTIVVDVDQHSELHIRRGRGRRAPIDIHVRQGRARAFFDAGEHKDYILLSTPLAEMQVTGSIIYAAHDLPETPGSQLGSLDSDCVVRLDGNDQEITISRNEKVIITAAGQADRVGITVADLESWKQLPDLNLASALAHRGGVGSVSAQQTWVGEYVTGGELLEDVASERSANIPSQTAVLPTATPPAAAIAAVVILTQRARPSLRASGAGRRVGGEEDGVDRQPLLHGMGAARGRGAGRIQRSVIPPLRSMQSGRSLSSPGGRPTATRLRR